MHHPEESSTQPWIRNNWARFKEAGVPVIYRSIGQSSRIVEKALTPLRKDGLKIVRYSPKEKNIPNYCGSDALIRFYKDPEEWSGWTGQISKVITVAQSMKIRGSSCNYIAFRNITSPFERMLYGPGNGDSGIHGGELSFSDLKKAYRENRAYFHTGTQPASYTLNLMEAMMTGIPVVALGSKFCNRDYPEQATYEVHEIIKNGQNGYCSNNTEELRRYVRDLLGDYELAKRIGAEGRKTAIELFGKEAIKQKWHNFLSNL